MNKQRIIIIVSWFSIGLVSIFFTLLLLVNYYLKNNLDSYLKYKFTEATNFKYSITFDKSSVNLFSETISTNNLIISNNNINEPLSYQIGFKSKDLKISGFTLYKYLTEKKLSITNIEFNNPELNLYINSNIKSQNNTQKSKAKTKNNLSQLSIHHISLLNLNTSIYNSSTDKKPFMELTNNHISVKDLGINLKTNNKDSLLTLTDIDLTINNLRYQTKDSLYTIQGKSIRASFSKSNITIDSLKLIPNYSKKEFANKVGLQTSRSKVLGSKISISGIDYGKLIKTNSLYVKRLLINDLLLSVYRDNTKPKDLREKPSLQSIIKNIPISFSLDTIELKNGRIDFENKQSLASATGKIFMDKIAIDIYHISNDSLKYIENEPIKANIVGDVFGKAKFTEHYTFPMKSIGESFTCSGSLSSIPLSSFNSLIAPSKYLFFKEGKIDEINFSFHANDNASNGYMIFKYHNLTINLLNKQHTKSGLKVLIGNFVLKTFKIHKSNPGTNGEIRKSKIYMKHNPYRYFLFYSMQSILSGIEPSIMKK